MEQSATMVIDLHMALAFLTWANGTPHASMNGRECEETAPAPARQCGAMMGERLACWPRNKVGTRHSPS
eukprot:14092127-Alexandrium_andersonii.AAC.1